MDSMKKTAIVHLILCFFICPIFALLPYTPSHIFVSPRHNNSLAYLLLSDSFTQNKTDFLSLNISGNVDAANPQYSVLLEDVPFHGVGKSAAFVPVIDRHGTIKVYAGDCQNSSNHGLVWQFDPDDNSPIGNGTWDRHALKQVRDDDLSNAIFPSANYLASGFTYAATNKDPESIYTFGGMCPFRAGSHSDGDDWISSAYYSQSVTTILDPVPSSNDTSSYHLKCSAISSDLLTAPAPLAGFSVTPLQPTYATVPTSGDVRIEQSFLLIGGHSQGGPVNISRVALFALPQNNWNLVDTSTISGSGSSDLAVRDDATNATVIGPRSGHSAVLSPDGSKVVVFGGWVGNTSTPAEPLVAILEVGKDYGGSGPWAWKTVPSMNNNGSGLVLTNSAGIFGHGATMLPGGIMMVTGGYTIPPRNSSKRSTSSPELNSQVFLYNVTSDSWITSYANPSEELARTSKKSHSGLLSSTSKKTGLGIGVGVGIPVVAGIALSIWLYARRRRTRRTRDQTIRNLALGAERFHFWDEPNMSSSFRIKPGSTWTSALIRDGAYPWTCSRGNVGNLSWRDDNGQSTAESDNLLGRAGSRGQSLQQQYSGLNNNGRGPPGDIHTIDEREEEEANATDSLIVTTQPAGQEDHTTEGDNYMSLDSSPDLVEDTNHHASLPTGKRSDDSPIVQNDRTASNLSDPSTTVSAVSAKSRFSRHSNNNDNGQRTTTLNNQPVLSSVTATQHSSPEQPTPPSTARNSETIRDSMAPVTKHDSADSFTTAVTGRSIQQAESENLIGGSGGMEHPQSWQWQSPPGSPSKKKTTTTATSTSSNGSGSSTTKAKGYGFDFGTLRRALTGVRKDTATLPGKRCPSAVPTGVGSSSVLDYSGPGSESFNESTTTAIEPSNSNGSTLFPRRAVSASAELYNRRKQGAKNWGLSMSASNNGSDNKEKEEIPRMLFSHTRIPRVIPRETALVGFYERQQAAAIAADYGNNDGDDNNEYNDHDLNDIAENEKGRDDMINDANDDDDDDWDVEAAEGRRVQVTFTVPKEKLRVVNATAGDLDGSSSSSDDDDDGYGYGKLLNPAPVTSRRSVSK